MRICVENNSFDARWGGGIAYSLAFTKALSELGHDAVIRFNREVDLEAVRTNYGFFAADVEMQHRSSSKKGRLANAVHSWIRDLRNYDMVVHHSTSPPRIIPGVRNAVLCDFPMKRDLSMYELIRVGSLSDVFVNSEFSNRALQDRWGRPAEVLHPPVQAIPRAPKKNWILSVGRFVGTGRSKHQLEMVQLFNNLHIPGWELHLAGFVLDHAYLEALMSLAGNAPIVIHKDPSNIELSALYGQSSIYWHFCGLYENERVFPEKMEHFGISTVEAMSAGCIPVVIGKGGQSEIVGTGEEAGYLWKSLEECAKLTIRLVLNEQLRISSAHGAELRARKFAFSEFVHRLECNI